MHSCDLLFWTILCLANSFFQNIGCVSKSGEKNVWNEENSNNAYLENLKMLKIEFFTFYSEAKKQKRKKPKHLLLSRLEGSCLEKSVFI